MDPAELSVQRIADRGREVLLARLRVAFEETAAAHSGLVQLDRPQLERMAQDAVDRAGGALWRRSLAEAAMNELDIPLAEAYDHPAVRRAQEMLGVPAYDSAERRARPVPAAPVPAAPAPAAPVQAVPAPASRRAPAAPPREPGVPAQPPAQPRKPDTPAPPPAQPRKPDAPAQPPAQPPEPDAPPDPVAPLAPDAIRVRAIHLEGIETLRPGARNIELRFSDIGVDVIDTHSGESIGRLTWPEIVSLELPRPRRSLRRRRGSGPELMVMTDRGLARFELRGISDEEAREHLAPVFERAQGSGT
jgi:hypothetical protein